jgi:hypothetical protein
VVTISAVHSAAAVQDPPADLINVAIDVLVRLHVRTFVDARPFQLVVGRLSSDDDQCLTGYFMLS